MDQLIERKPKHKSMRYRKAGAAVVLLLVASGAWFARGNFSISGVGVDRDSLVVGEVSQGHFTVTVRGPGTLLPAEVRWLVAEVDGYVEQVAVKAGESVTPGQVLMELSNPLLTQELAEMEWELKALKAEIRAANIALDSQLLNQELAQKEAEDAYLSAKMYFDAETELRVSNKSSVSYLNYKKSEREMNSHHRRWQNELRRYDSLVLSATAEKQANDARLNQLKNNVQMMREQVERLNVVAGMHAIVQEMPYEPGQRVSVGEPLSKLAKHKALYAELRIPEIQISKVAINQPVRLDTRNSRISGFVSRIDPAVRDGSVIVDVHIQDSLPDDARPDLSLEGIIKVTDINSTLSVARPLFAQSQGIAQVFKLDAKGKTAVRTPVRFGQGASDRIEVLEGLQAGDRIVLSDTSAWENNSKVQLN